MCLFSLLIYILLSAMCKISCKHERNGREQKIGLCVFHRSHIQTHDLHIQIICVFLFVPFFGSFFPLPPNASGGVGWQHNTCVYFAFFLYPENLSQCNINGCQYVCECVCLCGFLGLTYILAEKNERERLNNQ